MPENRRSQGVIFWLTLYSKCKFNWCNFKFSFQTFTYLLIATSCCSTAQRYLSTALRSTDDWQREMYHKRSL